MVAVLLGKPLPEDESIAMASWDSANLTSVDSAAGVIDDADFVIDEEPTDSPPSDEFIQEPAESYYRRIFQEYQDMRTAQGEVAVMTFVRFVEHLSASERRLREAFGCSHVRFSVVLRGSAVVFVPTPIDA